MGVQRMAILVEYRIAAIRSRTTKAEFEELLAMVGWPWTQNLHFPQDGHVITT